MRAFLSLAPIAAAILAATLLAPDARAQSLGERCAALKAQVDRIDQSGGRGDDRIGQYQDAIDRQTDELQRTVDYSQSLGCDGADDDQCRSLALNIRRMQRNLAVLQSQYTRIAANATDQREAERQRSLDRFLQLGCDGRQPSGEPRSAGLFEKFFGPDEMDPAYPLPPSAAEPDDTQSPADVEPSGTNLRTICVRKCDGFFFPVSFSTNAQGFSADAETCHKQCPTAEVELYYYDTFTQQPDDAISTVSGEPLRSMPNAFKFRTAFNASCTCKASGQGVQSVSPAEEALKRLDEQGEASALEPKAEAAPSPLPAPAPAAVVGETGRPAPARPGAPPQKPGPKQAIDSLPTTAGSTVETTTASGQKKKVRVVGPSYVPTE